MTPVFSKVKQAAVVANLVSLGRDPLEAIELSKTWAGRQHAQSLQHMEQTGRTRIHNQSGLGGLHGHLCASFHYSIYPLLFKALAESHPDRIVYSLIGSQTEQHQDDLKKLAGLFDFTLEFIKSGPHVVRAVRRTLASGTPVVILLDVPWSRWGAQPDIEYRVRGGSFLGLSVIPRLLQMIDPDYRVLCPHRLEGGLNVEILPGNDLGDAFAAFGDRLHADPADYERLGEFQKFFRFDTPCSIAVSFKVEDQRYAMHGGTFKAWRMSPSPELDACAEGVCAESQILAHVRDLSGDDVQAIVSI